VTDTQVDIGRRIAELRESRGMSQVALASALGITQPRMSQIESGRCPWMRLDDVEKIAGALGVRPACLVGWNGEATHEREHRPVGPGTAENRRLPERC